MPIFNQPNLAALQAAIVQAVADSQAAVIANSDSNAAAVVTHVTDETNATGTTITAEIAAKQTAIKSIQRVDFSLTTTTMDVTVSEMEPSKSVASITYSVSSGTAAANSWAVKVEVISATVIRLTRVNTTGDLVGQVEVVEYV